MAAPKNENLKRYWAYFHPDGSVQVRSISQSRKLAREMICKFETYTWQDYERFGYVLARINVKITVTK